MNSSTTTPFGAATTRSAQGFGILLWAGFGLVMTLFSCWVFGGWLLSDGAFRPVPIGPEDAIADPALMTLRVIEVLSTSVAIWALTHYLARPWLRDRRPGIEGLLLIGALISYVLDTTINYHDYLMAWNRHAFNFGTWGAFFPGHTGPTQYAEALFWGPPMYLYFGVVLGGIQLWVSERLHSRLGLGFGAALALSYVVSFVLDFAAESVIIHLGAYAWPYTIGALSVWPGSAVQFPLYESLLVGVYATGYALLIRSARQRPESFIEQGAARLAPGLQLPARLLAATGFASLMTLIYFVGYNLFSLAADTRVALPHYLQYADPNWLPPH